MKVHQEWKIVRWSTLSKRLFGKRTRATRTWIHPPLVVAKSLVLPRQEIKDWLNQPRHELATNSSPPSHHGGPSWVLAHEAILPVPAQALQPTSPSSQRMQARISSPKKTVPLPLQKGQTTLPVPAHSAHASVQSASGVRASLGASFSSSSSANPGILLQSISHSSSSGHSGSSESVTDEDSAGSFCCCCCCCCCCCSSSSSSANPGILLQSISHSSSSGHSSSPGSAVVSIAAPAATPASWWFSLSPSLSSNPGIESQSISHSSSFGHSSSSSKKMPGRSDPARATDPGFLPPAGRIVGGRTHDETTRHETSSAPKAVAMDAWGLATDNSIVS
ncbi:unnamed protein product [Pseudo-nitzschia multistriata]|uniref:Uncharacterized protein n=1 Tax=Pseudo-nitzschia multistriata TaxID=183589 RepID=A0A448ZEI3_9STRA|nr:unnamed protein product [Pseudo-nitzschia multistriata]